jgi:hypothetical protein
MGQHQQEELPSAQHAVKDALNAQQQLMGHKPALTVQMNMDLPIMLVLLV